MIETLKLCPFCGETPRIIEHEYKGESSTYGVRCRCGAQSFQFYEEPSLAANAWNTRKAEPPAWIPVTEALPDDDDLVLVSCQAKNGNRSINRAYYDGQFWHGSGSMSGVTAWMPMPEPYEEVRSDD